MVKLQQAACNMHGLIHHLFSHTLAIKQSAYKGPKKLFDHGTFLQVLKNFQRNYRVLKCKHLSIPRFSKKKPKPCGHEILPVRSKVRYFV